MKSRSLVIGTIAVGLLIAAVASDYLYSQKSEEKKQEASVVLKLSKDDIVSVQVVGAKNKYSILRKTKNEPWMITEPFSEEADAKASHDFIEALSLDKANLQVAEGNNINWAMYGLEQPTATIDIKTESGTTQKIEIGKENFQSEVYLRNNGENRVMIAQAIWRARADKDANDLRDRQVLIDKAGDLTEISEIRLTRSKENFVIGKKEGRWIWSAKPDLKMDQAVISNLVEQFKKAPVSQFLVTGQPTAADLKKYHLDQPSAQLEVLLKKSTVSNEAASAEKQEKKWKMFIGVSGSAQKKEIYLRTEEPARVMRINAGTLDRWMEITPEILRDRSFPFAITKDAVDEVEYIAAFKKEPQKLSVENVDKLMEQLQSTRAQNFIKSIPPSDVDNSTTLIFKNKSKELVRLVFSSRKNKKENNMYVFSTLSEEPMLISKMTFNAIAEIIAATDKAVEAATNTAVDTATKTERKR